MIDADRFVVEASDGSSAAPASTVASTVPPGTDESGAVPVGTTVDQNRSSEGQSGTDGDGTSSGSVPS